MKDHLSFTIPVARVDIFMVVEFQPSLVKYTGRQSGRAGRAEGRKALAPCVTSGVGVWMLILQVFLRCLHWAKEATAFWLVQTSALSGCSWACSASPLPALTMHSEKGALSPRAPYGTFGQRAMHLSSALPLAPLPGGTKLTWGAVVNLQGAGCCACPGALLSPF